MAIVMFDKHQEKIREQVDEYKNGLQNRRSDWDYFQKIYYSDENSSVSERGGFFQAYSIATVLPTNLEVSLIRGMHSSTHNGYRNSYTQVLGKVPEVSFTVDSGTSKRTHEIQKFWDKFVVNSETSQLNQVYESSKRDMYDTCVSVLKISKESWEDEEKTRHTQIYIDTINPRNLIVPRVFSLSQSLDQIEYFGIRFKTKRYSLEKSIKNNFGKNDINHVLLQQLIEGSSASDGYENAYGNENGEASANTKYDVELIEFYYFYEGERFFSVIDSSTKQIIATRPLKEVMSFRGRAMIPYAMISNRPNENRIFPKTIAELIDPYVVTTSRVKAKIAKSVERATAPKTFYALGVVRSSDLTDPDQQYVGVDKMEMGSSVGNYVQHEPIENIFQAREFVEYLRAESERDNMLSPIILGAASEEVVSVHNTNKEMIRNYYQNVAQNIESGFIRLARIFEQLLKNEVSLYDKVIVVGGDTGGFETSKKSFPSEEITIRAKSTIVETITDELERKSRVEVLDKIASNHYAGISQFGTNTALKKLMKELNFSDGDIEKIHSSSKEEYESKQEAGFAIVALTKNRMPVIEKKHINLIFYREIDSFLIKNEDAMTKSVKTRFEKYLDDIYDIVRETTELMLTNAQQEIDGLKSAIPTGGGSIDSNRY